MENVVVRPSPIHGRGVFATVHFQAGDLILVVDGSRLVTDEEPLREGEHEHHCDWLPDGRVILLPEPARYINHSCDPNAFTKYTDVVRYEHARRDIAAGEEITHDYCINDDFGDTVWQCNCGSSRCRKTIHSGFFGLPRALRVEYLPCLSEMFRQLHRERVDRLAREVTATRE